MYYAHTMNAVSARQPLKIMASSWAPVAHAYNPSNSGGRDQEDCGLRPALANSL
jgi:hypothetical protein